MTIATFSKQLFFGVCLQFQGSSSFLSWQGAWLHSGRRDDEVESSTSGSAGGRKRETLRLALAF